VSKEPSCFFVLPFALQNNNNNLARRKARACGKNDGGKAQEGAQGLAQGPGQPLLCARAPLDRRRNVALTRCPGADCGKRGPTWASINIGCFVCLSCSGIHRSLGTHVSQVRSVDLDTWKPEWVAVMKEWGNERANTVWEAKMPDGYDGKPNENEAQDLTPKMQKFIKDKYERKKFFSSSKAAKAAAAAATAKPRDDSAEEEPERPIKQKQRAPPKAAAVAAKPIADADQFNPFGDDVVFTQAPPPVAAPAAVVAAATAPAPKPAFDLSSLYAQSAPASQAPQWPAPAAPWAFAAPQPMQPPQFQPQFQPPSQQQPPQWPAWPAAAPQQAPAMAAWPVQPGFAAMAATAQQQPMPWPASNGAWAHAPPVAAAAAASSASSSMAGNGGVGGSKADPFSGLF